MKVQTSSKPKKPKVDSATILDFWKTDALKRDEKVDKLISVLQEKPTKEDQQR